MEDSRPSRFFLATPFLDRASWHLKLLGEFQAFLENSHESPAGEIRCGPWSDSNDYRPPNRPYAWIVRLDPFPQVRLHQRFGDWDPPRLCFPIFPEDLLEIVETAQRDLDQAINQWLAPMAAHAEELFSIEKIGRPLRKIVRDLADRPGTWQWQLHYGYAMRREVERLGLTAPHWGYCQAWQASPSLQCLSRSYPQLGQRLAELLHCETWSPLETERQLEPILQGGLPKLLRLVGLPGNPGAAKLLAKFPPDLLQAEHWPLLQAWARSPHRIEQLLNLPGPIPPKLLDCCPASEVHIAFPLLRNLHSRLVLRETAGRFTPGLPCLPVDHHPHDWKTALALLDLVPTARRHAHRQRLEAATSREALLRAMLHLAREVGPSLFGPFPVAGDPWIRPITSVSELEVAAECLRNCLIKHAWHYVYRIWQKRSYCYWVQVDTDVALLELTPQDQNRWVATQCRGVNNAPPPPTCLAKVRAWVQRHHLEHSAGLGQ